MSSQEKIMLDPEVIDDGRYDVHGVIQAGSGAGQELTMLAVHGEDSDTGRSVFLKLRNPATDEYAADRVRREAEVLGYLSHSQIPRLFEADPDAEVPYIVTELMPGGPIPVGEEPEHYSAKSAVMLGAAILEVLAYVHEEGIIHRDIKPANLLSTSLSNVNIVDFDIAQYRDQVVAREASDDDEPYHSLKVEPETQGIAIGSPGYLSPEQNFGRYAGPASDLYSVGAMLHKMLTGQLPPYDDSVEAIIAEHVESMGPEKTAEVDMPEELATVINRATQQDPSLRYQSADEMGEALVASVYTPKEGHHFNHFPRWARGRLVHHATS